MRWAVIVGMCLVVFAAACQTLYSPDSPDGSGDSSQLLSNDGNVAPDFTVTTIDGDVVRLSDYASRGRPVVVEFIATWCPHCSKDLDYALQVYGKYKDDVDILVIGIDLSEDEETLRSYRAVHGYDDFAFATGNHDILQKYNIRYTTTKYAIKADGTVFWHGSGELDSENWKKVFDGITQ